MQIEGERSVDIAAEPAAVWALVSDITRMGEWSPHTVEAMGRPGRRGRSGGRQAVPRHEPAPDRFREPWIVLVYYRLIGQHERIARGVEETLRRLKTTAEAAPPQIS